MANEIRPEDVRRIAAQKEREVLGEEGIRRFAEPSFFPETAAPRRPQENPYERGPADRGARPAAMVPPVAGGGRGPYDPATYDQGPHEQSDGAPYQHDEPAYAPAPADYADGGYRESDYDAPESGHRAAGGRGRGYREDDYGEADLGLPAGYSDGGYGDEDPYEAAPRRRRWLPMSVALLALAGFAGVVWYAYDWGSTGSIGDEPPIIQAKAGEERVKPENEGGIEVPNQETSVLNPEPEEPVAEVLMPPPEEPVEAPTPAAEPEEPAVELVETAPSGAAGPPAPPPDAAADGTGEAGEAQPVQEAAVPPEPQPAPAPQPVPQIAAGDFLIQLASLTSPDAAQRAWTSMQQQHASLLGAMALNIQEADIEGKGKFFRVQAGPLPNRATADDMCARLKAANQDCIVVKR